jgi:hypothetical protein
VDDPKDSQTNPAHDAGPTVYSLRRTRQRPQGPGQRHGAYPSYQAAPSFAYIIGEYTLDRNGVLTGPRNSQLMLTLDQDGYRTK